MFCTHLPVFMPDDVEEERDREKHERRAGGVDRALLERGEARSEDVEREDDRRERQRREVRDVRRPVEPARQEPLPLAEGLRRPDVEAAFLRDRRRERGHREALRDEEDERREHPEKERRRAVRGRERDPAHADDRGDVEEDDVPGLERALEGHRVVSSVDCVLPQAVDEVEVGRRRAAVAVDVGLPVRRQEDRADPDEPERSDGARSFQGSRRPVATSTRTTAAGMLPVTTAKTGLSVRRPADEVEVLRVRERVRGVPPSIGSRKRSSVHSPYAAIQCPSGETQWSENPYARSVIGRGFPDGSS